MTNSPPEPAPELRRQTVGRWLRRAGPWVAVAAILYLFGSHPMAGEGLTHGQIAPSLVTTLTGGEAFDLSTHRGKVVVVNFWGSWCPPCRAEAPALRAIHEGLATEGGLVLGVGLDPGSADEIGRSAARLGMDYPIALATPEVVEGFRVRMLPTTYVVAPDGTIADSFVGEVSEAQLRAAITHAREH